MYASSNKDTAYQISNRSDQRLPSYRFLVIIAPPSGKYGQLFLFEQRLYSYICVPGLVRISHFVHELKFFFVKLSHDF